MMADESRAELLDELHQELKKLELNNINVNVYSTVRASRLVELRISARKSFEKDYEQLKTLPDDELQRKVEKLRRDNERDSVEDKTSGLSVRELFLSGRVPPSSKPCSVPPESEAGHPVRELLLSRVRHLNDINFLFNVDMNMDTSRPTSARLAYLRYTFNILRLEKMHELESMSIAQLMEALEQMEATTRILHGVKQSYALTPAMELGN